MSMSELAKSLERSFGQGAVDSSYNYQLNSIPTGSLALDYALGTGGWPRGHLTGMFGPRDIGKSVMALHAVANAQRLGLNAVWIAIEPGFDPEWARKHGVDLTPEKFFVVRPDSGEDAFHMLHKIVTSAAADIVVFDSIGSLLAGSEIDENGKMKAGGQAGLITWGIKRVVMPIYKNNVAVLLLNQIRDNMVSRMPGVVQQPGGHALEHSEAVIVQLKRGKEQYKVKMDGEEVVIGSQVRAAILRNKLSEGTGKVATFDFYSMETPDYPFGIDGISDVIATARRTGVIKSRGAWLDLPNGESCNGQKQAFTYLTANPEVMDIIRNDVMVAMVKQGTRLELAQ